MIICFSVLISCADKRETYKVEAFNITESVYASGKIESKDQYQIMPKMAGLISKIHVIEGQEVKKGDLLLKFDIDLVKEKGYSTETMMSFELADKRTLQMQYTGQTQGKDVVAVVK